MKIAELLKKFRKKHNLSQVKLADLLGAQVYSVNMWENGKTTPSKFLEDKLKQLDIELVNKINTTNIFD